MIWNTHYKYKTFNNLEICRNRKDYVISFPEVLWFQWRARQYIAFFRVYYVNVTSQIFREKTSILDWFYRTCISISYLRMRDFASYICIWLHFRKVSSTSYISSRMVGRTFIFLAILININVVYSGMYLLLMYIPISLRVHLLRVEHFQSSKLGGYSK